MRAVSSDASASDLDAQLMLRVTEGCRESFDLLVLRHREPLVHFLYRMVQDAEVAEELAQEVFLRAFRARARYQPAAKFSTWLYRIATNLALNWLRRSRNNGRYCSLGAPECQQPPAGEPSVEQLLIKRALVEQVRRAVASLPERQRAVIILYKYHGLDHDQIACILGCSVQAVKSLAFRGYANLRRLLPVSLLTHP